MSKEEIEKVFNLIFSDEKKSEEFKKIDSMKELYEFCQSVKSGYTMSEFVKFISDLYESAGLDPKKIDDLMIGSVSGGKKEGGGLFKFISGTLAALTMSSGIAGAMSAYPGHCDHDSLQKNIQVGVQHFNKNDQDRDSGSNANDNRSENQATSENSGGRVINRQNLTKPAFRIIKSYVVSGYDFEANKPIVKEIEVDESCVIPMVRTLEFRFDKDKNVKDDNVQYIDILVLDSVDSNSGKIRFRKKKINKNSVIINSAASQKNKVVNSGLDSNKPMVGPGWHFKPIDGPNDHHIRLTRPVFPPGVLIGKPIFNTGKPINNDISLEQYKKFIVRFIHRSAFANEKISIRDIFFNALRNERMLLSSIYICLHKHLMTCSNQGEVGFEVLFPDISKKVTVEDSSSDYAKKLCEEENKNRETIIKVLDRIKQFAEFDETNIESSGNSEKAAVVRVRLSEPQKAIFKNVRLYS